MNKSALNWYKY